jgi:hypothetical protein
MVRLLVPWEHLAPLLSLMSRMEERLNVVQAAEMKSMP